MKREQTHPPTHTRSNSLESGWRERGWVGVCVCVCCVLLCVSGGVVCVSGGVLLCDVVLLLCCCVGEWRRRGLSN